MTSMTNIESARFQLQGAVSRSLAHAAGHPNVEERGDQEAALQITASIERMIWLYSEGKTEEPYPSTEE